MESIKLAAAIAVNNILQNSTMDRKNGDYVGEDGLWHCGNCGGRKETIISMPAGLASDGEKKVVPCECKCQVEERTATEIAEQHRQKMLHLERMKDASLMDKKYRNAKFSNYTRTEGNRKALKVATVYSAKFNEMYANNQGLILYGPVGTGKSYTAACIGNALLEQNVSVIMTSFVKILQNVDTYSEAEYIAMLNSAKLLILDDLGTERNTDYALEKVYNIIDSRLRASKPMILTTNLSLSDLMGTHDIRYQRIYDRILETCFPVEVSGDSFRRSSAEQRFDLMEACMEG